MKLRRESLYKKFSLTNYLTSYYLIYFASDMLTLITACFVTRGGLRSTFGVKINKGFVERMSKRSE